MFTSWLEIGEIGGAVTGALGCIALLAVATLKYRGADRIARRQMKWAVFGIYCATLPFAVAAGLTALDPRFGWLFFASFGMLPLSPISLAISVVRFNLFDIDRVLSAAASYNVLLVLLVGGGLAIVPRLAEVTSGLAGIDPGTGQIVLSLALAALVIPAHRRLRPQIDRVFFKERYALDHGIAELLPTLSACTDARDLTERAGTGLNGLLRQETCVVYTGAEQTYAPVFAKGRAVPPAFTGDSPSSARCAPAAGRSPSAKPDAARTKLPSAPSTVPRSRHSMPRSSFRCAGTKHSSPSCVSARSARETSTRRRISSPSQRSPRRSPTSYSASGRKRSPVRLRRCRHRCAATSQAP
jgi:hypothetical protein